MLRPPTWVMDAGEAVPTRPLGARPVGTAMSCLVGPGVGLRAQLGAAASPVVGACEGKARHRAGQGRHRRGAMTAHTGSQGQLLLIADCYVIFILGKTLGHAAGKAQGLMRAACPLMPGWPISPHPASARRSMIAHRGAMDPRTA